MSVLPKVSYAFIAGEVAESFYGRTDLTKYELGVSLARNFFVDYRGGLVSRAGTKYVAPLQYSGTPVKLARYRAQGDDYVLVFGANYIRFIRSGGYLLENELTVTGRSAGVFSVAAHGLSFGDMIWLTGFTSAPELNERFYEVGTTTTGTFELRQLDGTLVDTSAMGAHVGTERVARVVTVATPFTGATLADLDIRQRRSNELRITSLDYPRHKLTYVNDLTWTLEEITTSSAIAAPTGLAVDAGTGTAGAAFAVAAVVDGTEGKLTPYSINSTIVNYSATAGHAFITWAAVPEASHYNVYRSLLLVDGTEISYGQSLGYIGRALGPQFTDNNIVPDFLKTPPVFTDPFANGAIQYLDVTAGGTGNTNATTVTITDPTGTGFEGYPVVKSGGVITAVVVVNGGSGYTSPTVVISGPGSGATATATVGELAGNNPRIFTMFQQREVYLGTANQPMTLWASKPGTLGNFDVSSVLTAGDSYSFTLDGVEIDPIYHALALRSGLLVFTADGITLLRAEEGKAVSGVNALAEPQAYKGASRVPPITIDLDVVFAQKHGSAVNAMAYTEYTNTFDLEDISVLSSHLLGEGKNLLRMEWVAEPDKLIYALREDGVLLTVTYERQQKVFGWAQHETCGKFKDIVAVDEAGRTALYAAVARPLEGPWGRWAWGIEVFQPRERAALEDHWGVDAGLSYDRSYRWPAVTMFVNAATRNVTLTVSSSYFTPAMVGDVVFLAGAKAVINEYVSGTKVYARMTRIIEGMVAGCPTFPTEVPAGEWSIVTPTDVVGGLWHLEGKNVSVLADGDAYLDLPVVDGQVTLEAAASKIVVGLPYLCRARTLPLNIMQQSLEGRRKDLLQVVTRVLRTRGLSIGPDFDSMVEFKDRTSEAWGEMLRWFSGMISSSVNSGWEEDVYLCYEQSYPLPATILGLTQNFDVGDD